MLHLALVCAAIAAALFLYVKYIRPAIRNLPHIKEQLDRADTWWAWLWIQLRAQWDGIVGFAAILIPQLPDLLEQFTYIDLSAVMPSDTAKTVMAIVGLVLLALKAFVIKKTS